MRESDLETTISTLLHHLKELNEYAIDMLRADTSHPDNFYPRKKYLYGQSLLSIAFSDGIATLAEKRQLRSIVPLFRSVWEIAVNIDFVRATRSDVWLYHLVLRSELDKKAQLEHVHERASITDEQYADLSQSIEKTITFIRIKYSALPVVPGVTTKSRDLTRSLTVRQRCEIIDYYKLQGKRVTAVMLYDSLYSYLSGTSHASATELDGLYSRDELNNLTIDISGGANKEYLAMLLKHTYIHQYQIIRVLLSILNNPKQRLPEHIKKARREIVSMKLYKE